MATAAATSAANATPTGSSNNNRNSPQGKIKGSLNFNYPTIIFYLLFKKKYFSLTFIKFGFLFNYPSEKSPKLNSLNQSAVFH